MDNIKKYSELLKVRTKRNNRLGVTFLSPSILTDPETFHICFFIRYEKLNKDVGKLQFSTTLTRINACF
jgi:hypothetical protein